MCVEVCSGVWRWYLGGYAWRHPLMEVRIGGLEDNT